LDDIQKLEKTEIQVNSQVIYDERFFIYLLLGVSLVLAAEVLRRISLKDVL